MGDITIIGGQGPVGTMNPPTCLDAAAEAISAAQEADAAADRAERAADSQLLEWAYSQTFRLVSAVRDTNDAIVTANIVWPNGITGVFTTDTASVEFPGAIDAWHATYLSTPPKTVTQPAVTRNDDGAVIAQPAITVS